MKVSAYRKTISPKFLGALEGFVREDEKQPQYSGLAPFFGEQSVDIVTLETQLGPE